MVEKPQPPKSELLSYGDNGGGVLAQTTTSGAFWSSLFYIVLDELLLGGPAILPQTMCCNIFLGTGTRSGFFFHALGDEAFSLWLAFV